MRGGKAIRSLATGRGYRKLRPVRMTARKKSTSPRRSKARSARGSLNAGTALRETAERLRAILETAVEAIITIDERGIIESANPACERLFGYRASEIIGSNVSVLMPSPYREQHDGYIANYLRSGKAKIIGIGREVVGQRKDGSVFPMDLSVSEVKLADRRLFTGFVRDLTVRKRLETEVLDISDREQQRIGQDLHDGLGQHLTGIELMSQVLEQRVASVKSRDAQVLSGEVAKITRHVRDAISQTRSLARGLSPVVLESEGLMAALHQLAAQAEQMFQIQCRFECDPPVLVDEPSVATHLYRIAQEAVSNAVKHGKARKVIVRLRANSERLFLMVKDDGVGISKSPPKSKGMGLRIMQYRAGMIGGSLVVQREPDGGTSVLCSVQRRPYQKVPRK